MIIRLQAFDEDEFRQRIQKLTDEKLIEYGRACKWDCPYPDRDDGDLQARSNLATQLRLCWERMAQTLPSPTQFDVGVVVPIYVVDQGRKVSIGLGSSHC